MRTVIGAAVPPLALHGPTSAEPSGSGPSKAPRPAVTALSAGLSAAGAPPAALPLAVPGRPRTAHVSASLAMAVFLGGSGALAVLPETPLAARWLAPGTVAQATLDLSAPPALVTASLTGGAETLLWDALAPTLSGDLTRAEALPETRVLTVSPGDTLSELLLSAGATPLEAHEAIAALKPHFNPRSIQAGQDVTVTVAPAPVASEGEPAATAATEPAAPPAAPRLLGLELQADLTRHVSLDRGPDQAFVATVTEKVLSEKAFRATATIDSSLFLAADTLSIPNSIIAEMIRLYSYDVDFQREIRKGDSFDVLFTRMVDEDGKALKEGKIVYAALTASGETRRLWRFTPKDGVADYFDENGKSAKKFLIRTPVDGARLTSGFGMRKHPILGYSKMHKGVDFAAPRGTPVVAAAHGTVEYAARNGAYGNYVRIRHANGYKTAYAHLNAFAKGIKKGAKVSQGQRIGFVGTTGRSTGPHLHYEVLANGTQVNPMGVKLPTGTQLAGQDLKSFTAERGTIETALAEAEVMGRFKSASADAPPAPDTLRQ